MKKIVNFIHFENLTDLHFKWINDKSFISETPSNIYQSRNMLKKRATIFQINFKNLRKYNKKRKKIKKLKILKKYVKSIIF